MRIRGLKVLDGSVGEKAWIRELIKIEKKRDVVGSIIFLVCVAPFLVTAASWWDFSLLLAVGIGLLGGLISGKIVLTVVNHLMPKGVIICSEEKVLCIGASSSMVRSAAVLALQEYCESSYGAPYTMLEIDRPAEKWMKQPRFIAMSREEYMGMMAKKANHLVG